MIFNLSFSFLSNFVPVFEVNSYKTPAVAPSHVQWRAQTGPVGSSAQALSQGLGFGDEVGCAAGWTGSS